MCEHKALVIVYTTGKDLPKGGNEKDLLVRCTDCNEELFRTSVYNRAVISLINT